MAKRKAGRGRRPVSLDRIAQARYAKRHGLLSKSAKTSEGKLSKRVEHKLDRLGEYKALPSFTLNPNTNKLVIDKRPMRVPVKVPRKLRTDAALHHFEIFNGFVLAKSDQAGKVRSNIAKGFIAGAQRRPGAEDVVDVIVLNDDGIGDYPALHRALRNGKLDRKYLKGDLIYTFTFMDNHAGAGGWGRTFVTGPELAKYLEHYKWTEEAFDRFELLTLPAGESIGPSPPWVKERNKRERLARMRGNNLRAKNMTDLNDRRVTKQGREFMTEKEAYAKTLERNRRYKAEKRAAMGAEAFKREIAAQRKVQRDAKKVKKPT